MKVFYRPEQTAQNPSSYSPSAGKPALVVQDWIKHGFITVQDIQSFDPVSRSDIKLAHDEYFVDAVIQGVEANGFGNYDPDVAASLPYTLGSMVAASLHAFKHRENTCSPTSGFHHAGYDYAGGYCTFNGLMVAALKLRQQGAKRVGILDCDMHYGDGTADIIETLRIDWIVHRTQGGVFYDPSRIKGAGTNYFAWLEQSIEDMAGCDVVLYQAGADPHVNDPLGGLLTTGQMLTRDHTVFNRFAALGVPVCWNLAGGYQRGANGTIDPVLELHRNTVRIAVDRPTGVKA